MIFALTKQQLEWVLQGTRYQSHVKGLFADHYVRGFSKAQAAKANDCSLPFASKKFTEFDKLVESKCEKHDLQLSTVFHSPNDRTSVYKYDITRKPKKKPTKKN